jgi:nuclear cap-binding protein subunit 1
LIALTKSYNTRFTDTEMVNLKAEYVLLEALLVKALTEKDAARLGYLCSMLTHLVKVDAKLVSPALAIVIELLFREVPLMSASGVDAFVKLFSHFLSNYEFKWAWSRWNHVLEASEDDPQRLFVSSVIERCVRLSYLQHMQSVLPAELHALLPPEPKPRVIYSADANDESSLSSSTKDFFQAVADKLKTHPPPQALYAWLEEELNGGAAIERHLAVDIVFTAILNAGAATFTHCRLMLEKYGVLGDLFRGEDAELLLVKTVGFVWVNSPQHIGIILNMMLRQRVIQATTIAKWIFTSDAIQQYSWPYVWGILDETLTFLHAAIRVAMREQQSSGGDVEMQTDDERTDRVKRLEDELRELLKIVFAGFNRVIAEYKSNCDADGISYKDNWFLSALSQMKAVGGKFRVVLDDIVDELLTEVFHTSAADPDAKKVFDFVRDSYRSD